MSCRFSSMGWRFLSWAAGRTFAGNFEAMDPLEWLARLTDHIPYPGRHRTHFYALYANRVRGERRGEEEPRPADEAEPPTRRRSWPSWARLTALSIDTPLSGGRCPGGSDTTAGPGSPRAGVETTADRSPGSGGTPARSSRRARGGLAGTNGTLPPAAASATFFWWRMSRHDAFDLDVLHPLEVGSAHRRHSDLEGLAWLIAGFGLASARDLPGQAPGLRGVGSSSLPLVPPRRRHRG